MKPRHIVINIILVLLLALSAGGAFHFWNISQDQASLLSASRVELQQANLTIGRGKTTIADANKRLEVLAKEVHEEVVKRRASLTMVAELQAKLDIEKKNVKVRTRVIYRNSVERVEVDLPKGKIFVEKDGKYLPVENMSYSYKDHRITITGDAIKGTLSYRLHQKFRATVVESKLPGGGYNHYATLWELSEEGKDEKKLSLTSFSIVKTDELAPHMWWWNPHIDLLGGLVVTGEPAVVPHVEVGVSVMSYGKTADDMTWRFLRVGIGAVGLDELSLSISPVMYNVGKPLPLISNLWITPTVVYQPLSNEWGGGLGLSVVF